MRSALVLSSIAAFAVVGAQDIDFAGVDAIPDPVIDIIPGLTEQVVPFNENAAIAAVASAVAADPLDVKPVSEPTAAPKLKRHMKRAACDPEPSNPNTYGFDLSSAAKFRADPKIASVANGASTPSGYFNTFTNLQGASSAYGYLGYKVVTSYDPSVCASLCDSKSGCLGFNIYVERDPSKTPGEACTNPDAIANIKCSFWGGPVYTDTATNKGQWRRQFEVAIAGSNGYSSLKTQAVDGYKQVELKNNAINAPLDCNKQGSYMGYQLFTQGAFDAKLCATACKEHNKYAIAHPPENGKPQLCRYFNTYILLKNSVSQGQYCSMYTQEWDASFATNNGQYRGTDKYTIQYSFGFTDNSYNGVPVCPSDIAYLKEPDNAAFCSSYISYAMPTNTVSAVTTISTVAVTTVDSTVVSTPDPTTALTTEISYQPTTVVDTVTVTVTVAPARLRRSAENATTTAYSINTEIWPFAELPASVISAIATADSDLAKREALPTPVSVATWPASMLSAACSQVATGTVTATVITGTSTVFTSTETAVSTVSSIAPVPTVTVTVTLAVPTTLQTIATATATVQAAAQAATCTPITGCFNVKDTVSSKYLVVGNGNYAQLSASSRAIFKQYAVGTDRCFLRSSTNLVFAHLSFSFQPDAASLGYLPPNLFGRESSNAIYGYTSCLPTANNGLSCIRSSHQTDVLALAGGLQLNYYSKSLPSGVNAVNLVWEAVACPAGF